jgi:hypothetical protein
MKKSNLIMFLFGFFSCSIIAFLLFGIPQYTGLVISGTSSPEGRIEKENILLYEDKIIINIQNASISNYASSSSMNPLINDKSSGIRIVPSTEEEISIGDIVSFERNDKLIVHRVVKKGIDKEGIYFITKGDGSIISDGKVRFHEIRYITIGILW